MIYFLKILTIVLNFLILISFITYTFFFNFKIENEFLSNFIIVITIIALFFKLLYWHFISRFFKMINFFNKSVSLLLRVGICIFLYITPSYYIIQNQSLIIRDHVISITLLIISILIFIGIFIEQSLFNFEKNYNQNNLNEKN